ncbi:NAD-dependent epimerase/dehydratase family protein [Hydrogenophaga sp.]|uniref:UDP-2-acetamido-2,6-beta-L-arabino-hexul-4-ose reductase n=1 Tax=Hydrogenophaga sp. TaxID=1904254 RepID=UPI0035B3B5D7
MKVLVTGANGFIGKNLVLRLREKEGTEVLTLLRNDGESILREALARADAVVHLAGENRPADPAAFAEVNVCLTQRLCDTLQTLRKPIPVLFTSSIQAELDNPYGRSKRDAEDALAHLAQSNGNPVVIYRLPGVFGKWCRPNYNSVVATFCYNKAHDLPVQINDFHARVRLNYVDDVVNAFLRALEQPTAGLSRPTVAPEYTITLGELSDKIDAFKNCRDTLVSERVGTGLTRALYATYVSYLPVEKFVYDVPAYGDSRGVFVEMLKTPDAGQFSFFTAHPGITRGGHYHHTKTEKFLVIKGHARFGFRHMLTNEVHHLEAFGDQPQVVETVPGWTHDITNIGTDEMVVMLWANEIYDRTNPDTFYSQV